jgi:uroporphyrinogen-III synthase
MSKRALVTRPREDAQGLCQALEARGFEVQREPLLEIILRQGVDLPLAGVQGILATSANGVRALAVNGARRDLPIWAVGSATAECAQGFGFNSVEAAGGDVSQLAELVAGRVDPRAGALLHAAGSELAGDLSESLTALGFEIRRSVLYEARTPSAFSPGMIKALDAEELDLALFFSPRTAATFARLTQAAQLNEACLGINAYALSPAVAEQLAVLPWRRVRTAGKPDQTALLAVIDADRGR